MYVSSDKGAGSIANGSSNFKNGEGGGGDCYDYILPLDDAF